MTVALVIVSHSDLLARGVREVAAQMAPDVRIIPAGGTTDGEIGTSYDLVVDALSEANTPAGVLVLADLGSATLVVQTAIEFLDPATHLIRLADAPIVEGAVAAAVAAQGGADLDSVLGAAERAGRMGPVHHDDGPPPDDGPGITRHLTLRNELGLHARPAARLARLAAGFDAAVEVNGVDATSVLELMRLGLVGGQRMDVVATGPQADDVLEAIALAVADGFGES